MYYTDWGDDAKVVRCRMDGSSRDVLLRGLQNPNSLALTVDGSTLYVVDAQLKRRSTTHSSTLIQLSTAAALNAADSTATNLPQIDVFSFLFCSEVISEFVGRFFSVEQSE